MDQFFTDAVQGIPYHMIIFMHSEFGLFRLNVRNQQALVNSRKTSIRVKRPYNQHFIFAFEIKHPTKLNMCIVFFFSPPLEVNCKRQVSYVLERQKEFLLSFSIL